MDVCFPVILSPCPLIGQGERWVIWTCPLIALWAACALGVICTLSSALQHQAVGGASGGPDSLGPWLAEPGALTWDVRSHGLTQAPLLP